jgi:hypothetical protein
MERKLDIGSVFERVFAIYRDQFTLLIPAALVLFVPVAILNGLVLSTGSILGSLLAAAIAAVATYWYQGMVVSAAEDILDGRRDHSLGSLLRSTTPVIAPLFGAGLLAGIAVAIGFVLLIVPGLYLLTIWAVIAPVIVLERAGVFESFGRSRHLVKGNGWQVFGVIVILFLLGFVIQLIIGAAIDDSFALLALADLIVRMLVAPLAGLAAAVMYFGLKAAKEGDAAVVPQPAAAGGPEAVPTGPPATPEPGGPPPQAPPPSDVPGGAPPQAPGGAPGGPPPQAPPAGGPQSPAG